MRAAVLALCLVGCREREAPKPVTLEVKDASVVDSEPAPDFGSVFAGGKVPSGCEGTAINLLRLECPCIVALAPVGGVVREGTTCGAFSERSAVDKVAIESPRRVRMKPGDRIDVDLTLRNLTDEAQPVVFSQPIVPASPFSAGYELIDSTGASVTYAKGDKCRRYGSTSMTESMIVLPPKGIASAMIPVHAASLVGNERAIDGGLACDDHEKPLALGKYTLVIRVPLAPAHGLARELHVEIEVYK
jgi:hypothetical protein